MLEQAPQQGEWLALLILGGPVVLVLLCMSVVALAVTLYKLLQLRAFSRRSLDRLDDAVTGWCRGEAGALDSAAASGTPLASIICDGMRWLAAGDRDPDAVETELARMAQQLLGRLRSLLGILEQVAYLAPLLGLLGTVLGIIDVFHGLAEQGPGADPGQLAGGIWEALLTTAVGLCVAIPFALAQAGLQGRIDAVRARAEDMLTRLFTAGLYRGPGDGG